MTRRSFWKSVCCAGLGTGAAGVAKAAPAGLPLGPRNEVIAIGGVPLGKWDNCAGLEVLGPEANGTYIAAISPNFTRNDAPGMYIGSKLRENSPGEWRNGQFNELASMNFGNKFDPADKLESLPIAVIVGGQIVMKIEQESITFCKPVRMEENRG